MGKRVATKLKEVFAERLRDALETTECLNEEGITNALTAVLVELGQELSERADPVGSCAIIIFVFQGIAYTANVGDSRAIKMTKDGKIIQLSEDADPENERFKKSIIKKKYGAGHVYSESVNGVLCVARDIGFQSSPGLIAKPKITYTEFLPGEIICIGCDGLFEAATSENVGQEIMKNRSKDPKELASSLVKAALGNESGII